MTVPPLMLVKWYIWVKDFKDFSRFSHRISNWILWFLRPIKSHLTNIQKYNGNCCVGYCLVTLLKICPFFLLKWNMISAKTSPWLYFMLRQWATVIYIPQRKASSATDIDCLVTADVTVTSLTSCPPQYLKLGDETVPTGRKSGVRFSLSGCSSCCWV